MDTYTGIIPPLLTPLTADGAPDIPTLRKHVDRLIRAGVDGVFALGSSGEAVFLGREERRDILRAVVEHVAGRVPVLAGVIAPTTPLVTACVADAVELGVDGLVATAPFYVRTHHAEIADHFRRIHAAAPDIPLYAYNIPVSVQVNLAPSMVLDLAAEGVLQGIKDSGGVDGYTRALIDARDQRGLGDFAVLTGSETTVDMMYLVGADGAVPGLGNVDPVGYVELARACREGRWDDAVHQQRRLNALMQIAFQGDAARMGGSSAGVGSFKAALHHMGLFPEFLMSPTHVPLNAAERAAIAAIVDAAHIVEP